jgi:threonine synthase
MQYASTRGEAPELGFSDVLLAGLARDGGLYVPKQWPHFSKTEIAAMRGLSYPDLAVRLLTPFVAGDIPHDVFEKIVHEAYATFRHEAVCPLVQLGPNLFSLELFHGPTLAFKDVAMQLLARLMDHVLAERGERATIVGATSGDTGGAAIDAFAGRARSDIFILFPHGKVSPVQQRQMTTSTAANVHALAIEGNFDDCQNLVKGMFNDHKFRDGVALSGVNSINWARIMAQIVYYFSSALTLGAPDRPCRSPFRPAISATFLPAMRQTHGPADRPADCRTNDNDIWRARWRPARYEMRGVTATTSPSMDIQISSNFERLLFEASGRNAAAVRGWMDRLKQSGSFSLDAATLRAIRAEFDAGRSTMSETASEIKRTLDGSGYLLDPHSAIGVHVARQYQAEAPMIVLATAHPAKFPAAVEQASGVNPALPDWLSDLMERKENYNVLPSDLKMVEEHISRRSNAAKV